MCEIQILDMYTPMGTLGCMCVLYQIETQGLLRVLEGKLVRLIQRVLTIWIEQIPVVM